MGKKCCVSSCSSEWNPYTHISLFSFPWKDDIRKREWLKIVPTKCKITKNSRVCSLHFQDELVEEKFGKRVLKKYAIPTIFDNEGRNKTYHRQMNNNKDCENRVEQNDDPLQTTQDSKCFPQFVLVPLATDQNVAYEMIGTHSSLPRKKEMKSVGTQVSPHHLEPSTRELNLQQKLKDLQGQLRIRNKQLKAMSQLLKELKQSQVEVLMREKTC